MKTFDTVADTVTRVIGSLPVVLLAFLSVILWGAGGFFVGFTDTYQLLINTGTTIITFLMVFIVQHTQTKNDLAVQVKLDELIKAVDKTNEAVIGIEKSSEKEIRKYENENENEKEKENKKKGNN